MSPDLFDSTWYSLMYPEYEASTPLPLVHYINIGWKQGHNPAPLFSTAWYLASQPDCANSGLSPLEHFLKHGRRRGAGYFPESASPAGSASIIQEQIRDACHYLAYRAGLLDAGYYCKNNQCTASEFFRHYRDYGSRENRRPSACFDPLAYRAAYMGAEADVFSHAVMGEAQDLQLLRELLDGSLEKEAIAARLYDDGFYRLINGDIPPANGFLHYMLLGWREEKNPGPGFNTAEWLAIRPDAASSNPLYDYLRCQEKPEPAFEGEPGHIGDIALHFCVENGLFDEEWYLDKYPEVAASGMSAQEHYRKYGFRENRQPCAAIDWATYIDRYLGGDSEKCAIAHYCLQGKNAGNKLVASESEMALMDELRMLHELIR